MWRRFGDVAFAALVAVVVTVEAVPLTYLTWLLLGRLVGSSGGPRVGVVLLGAVASAALGLVTLTVYLLAFQHVSERRASKRAERRRSWVARWLDALYGSEPLPGGPIGRDAVDALLDVRETLRGSDAVRVMQLLERYGVDTTLERRARSGRLASRLEALDALARSRIPATMPTLVAAMRDRERAIQVAAARAAARTLAGLEDPHAREGAAQQIVAALEGTRLPFGVLEEVLLLADDAAPSLVAGLLDRDGSPAALRAALDAVARLQLLVFAEEVVRFLRHADPEVRAAALRAVARTGLLPPHAASSVLAAAKDDVEFIRIHATAAARLLPREDALDVLWDALGDPSWWVRRAAAEAMSMLGRAGLAELGRAARSHGDRYARDMAAQALRDRVPDLVEAVTR